MTLILLRPDGSNRTYQFRKGTLIAMISGGILVVLVAITLTALLILQVRAGRRIAEQYQLLAGGQVLALSPRPAAADAVPMGAWLDSSSAGDAEPAVTSGVRTSTGSRPAGSPETAEPVGESPVRLEDFRAVFGPSPSDLTITVQLTKREWDDVLLRGYAFIAIEDAASPGRYLTRPPATMRDGRPVSPQTGESFAIRRLKPLQYDFTLPDGFAVRRATILVYDRQGRLLLVQEYPLVEGP